MKKLMIAAAIVCAAAFAQAASCSWGVTFAFTGEEGGASYENVDSAGNYWLIALTDSSTEGIGVDADGNIVLGEGMTELDSGSYTEGALAGTLTGLAESDNNKYLALVMFDTTDKMFGVSDAAQLKGIITDPPTDADGIEFSNGFFTALDYDCNGMQLSQAVPEPTTGLLMLLGMAGLALRRRRA